nr:MAG TPA: hypothetical protein [Bacteriophage sp.]
MPFLPHISRLYLTQLGPFSTVPTCDNATYIILSLIAIVL